MSDGERSALVGVARVAAPARGWSVIDDLSLPMSLAVRDATVLVRRATSDDLGAIIRLLSDDPISAGRGDVVAEEDVEAYASALDRIVRDPGNELVVVVDGTEAVVGTLQLTVVPGMARRGSTRLLVEAVRVAGTHRSSGIGSALMRWVVDQAAVELRAPLVQLTSDAARVDAHRFYERLGFVGSHVGFKYTVALPDVPAGGDSATPAPPGGRRPAATAPVPPR